MIHLVVLAGMTSLLLFYWPIVECHMQVVWISTWEKRQDRISLWSVFKDTFFQPLNIEHEILKECHVFGPICSRGNINRDKMNEEIKNFIAFEPGTQGVMSSLP